VLFGLVALVGIAVSITGNETAQRWDRARVVTAAMSTAALLSLIAGWSGTVSAPVAALLVVLWNAAIYFDSSALTAGTVQAAGKELRGVTMGLHSMCGYAGGCIGPLGVGFVLDLVGDDSALGWGLGFGHLALFTLVGLAVLRRVGRSAQPRRSRRRTNRVRPSARRLGTERSSPPLQPGRRDRTCRNS
jgi:MFS family permease